MISRRDVLLIMTLFIATRVLLIVVGTFAVTRIPSSEGPEFTHLLDGGPALDMWYRWDAGFYATIATYGYDWQRELRPTDDMAFFPLYPYAVRAVMDVTHCAFTPYLSTCATVAGLIVSNVALFAAVLLLFDLARRQWSRAVAWRAVLLLMLSPAGVFLSGVYTEGLFLFLCVWAFWALDREKFGLAVLAAALACLTRFVGIALVPPLLFIAWRSRTRRISRMALALVPAVALGAYIVIAGITAGDLVAYFRANASTWGRVAGSPVEAFTVYFSGQDVSFFGWRLSWLDLVAAFGYLALAVATLRRRLDWGLFALGAVLIPIASSSLISMPRYGMTIFPFYVLIGAWASRRWQQALVYGLSLALLLLFTTRFVTWRWIA